MLRLHTDRILKVPNGLVSKRQLAIGKLIRDHPSPFRRVVGPVEAYVNRLYMSLYSGSRDIANKLLYYSPLPLLF